MTDARPLRFPVDRPCPQCGHHLRSWTHCDYCDAEPILPWTCPRCGTTHEATFRTICGWSIGAIGESSPDGVGVGVYYICPSCPDKSRPVDGVLGQEQLRKMLGHAFDAMVASHLIDDPDLDEGA